LRADDPSQGEPAQQTKSQPTQSPTEPSPPAQSADVQFQVPVGPQFVDRPILGGRFCGLYSLFGALKALGHDVAFADLLKSKYIGSHQGSSSEELKRAAEDAGAHALPVEGLTAESLEASQLPIVLHVSANRKSKQTLFDHWVLFVGMDGKRARIVDAPRELELVPLADVLARWDGTGVIVSNAPIKLPLWRFLPSYALGFLLLGGVAVVLVRWATVRWTVASVGWRRYATESIGLLAVAAIAGLVCHAAGDEGFFKNRHAVASIVASQFTRDFARLDYAGFVQARSEPRLVVIDARYAATYAERHIPGAISFPVDATLDEQRQALQGISNAAPVAIYCQSEGCPFSEEVGYRLAALGFESISIYTGGWKEWEQKAVEGEGAGGAK
jgi:rhodanese-related sulfurtransferase